MVQYISATVIEQASRQSDRLCFCYNCGVTSVSKLFRHSPNIEIRFAMQCLNHDSVIDAFITFNSPSKPQHDKICIVAIESKWLYILSSGWICFFELNGISTISIQLDLGDCGFVFIFLVSVVGAITRLGMHCSQILRKCCWYCVNPSLFRTQLYGFCWLTLLSLSLSVYIDCAWILFNQRAMLNVLLFFHLLPSELD